MIFSFGPSMLVEVVVDHNGGISDQRCAWLTALSAPIGGFLADRTARHDAIMVSSFLAFCNAVDLCVATEAIIPAIIALGMCAARRSVQS